MKKIIQLVIITVIFNLSNQVKGQDLSFSQFYENPLLRNPALAGVFEGDIRLIGTNRNQWQSITVPYKTQAFSTEVKFPIGNNNDWATGGLQITHDVAGDIQLKRTQVMPVFNYHLFFGDENYLSLAVMGGPVQSQFDPTQIKFGDQFDANSGAYNPNIISRQQFSKTGFTYWDLSTGISWNSSFPMDNENVGRYYLGVGMFHVNNPKMGSFITLDTTPTIKRKYTFNGGLTLPVSDNDKIIFYGDYFVQGGSRQFFGGLMYGRNVFHDFQPLNEDRFNDISIYGGAFYRWNDAIVPAIKLDMFSLSVGLSYDVTVSTLQTYAQSKGGFEFTLSYKAKLNNRRTGGYNSPYGTSNAADRNARDQVKCKPTF